MMSAWHIKIFKPVVSAVRTLKMQSPLFVRITPQLFGEPLKKKRRIDPAILRQREERKKKKLEKQIKRLEKNAKQLKPIDECEVPLEIIQDPMRKREIQLSRDEINSRAALFKDWSLYKRKQHLADVQMIDRILYSQQLALDQLKYESEELYQAAVQIDQELIPHEGKGPVETPPIEGYDSPDGEYIDISKKWDR